MKPPLLPNDPESEKAVIGGILLLGTGGLEKVLKTGLDFPDFHDERLSLIMKASMDVALQDQPIDTLTVKAALDESGNLERVGIEFLIDITSGIPQALNLEAYAERVRSKAKERRAIIAAQGFISACMSGNGLTSTATANLGKALSELGSGSRTEIKLCMASDALEPQPEREWIVRDLIGTGDIVAVVGDAGSKKTYTAYDLSVSVASGTPWLGRNTTPSNVLIVDEESGPRRLKMRLGDCMRGHNSGPDLPIAFTSMAGLTLSSNTGADVLRGVIAESQARLVVMDAFQDFTLGADENSIKDIAPAIYRLRQIVEFEECAIWLIHHLNKQGGFRGHSSIKGLIEMMLKCESDPDSSLITFTPEKSRDGIIKPFGATAYFEPGRFWLAPAEPKAQESAERSVKEFLTAQPDMTAKMTDIVANIDICAESSIRKAISELRKKDLLKRVDGGGQGKKATYQWIGEVVKRPT